MSIKGFHIVFIIASIILAILFGLWSWNYSYEKQSMGYFFTSIGCFLAALFLILYEIRFIKKIKTLDS